jgi:penicillin-binding protein 1B
MREFQQPSGVVDVQLDKVTNRLATSNCTDDYVSAFVAGTEPRDTCDAQAGMKGFFSRMFGGDKAVQPQSGREPPGGEWAGPEQSSGRPGPQEKEGVIRQDCGNI